MSDLSDEAKVQLIQTAVQSIITGTFQLRRAGQVAAADQLKAALEANQDALDTWLGVQRKARS